ncbi:MAG: DUF262 domain-containing protein [Thiomargarita sp.]|nr:DUF262 domain-containing protein [Thiomargarita sp.]
MLQNNSEICITSSLVNDSCDQIAQLQRKLGHSARNFSVDYIVEQFCKKHFFIQNFQRSLVWGYKQRARFIESVMLGFPIPFMFIASTQNQERFEIIDGSQRIQTLVAFLTDHLKLDNLEILPSLNGFKFSDLPLSQQDKLKSRLLTVFLMRKTAPFHIMQEMFKRLHINASPCIS